MRDTVLTLLAWALLFWFMRHLRLLVWLGTHPGAEPPASFDGLSLQPQWDIVAPFLQAAGLIILLLAFQTWRRRGQLRAQPRVLSEPALDPARQAARFGLDLAQLAVLRAGNVRVVRFDDDGRIAAIEPPPG